MTVVSLLSLPDNFKSLSASKQTKEEEDSEFQQQRQATIAEALTAKTKTFGGGQKQYVNDRDVARIVEMGFSPEQASSALRQCGGNLNEAIGGLLGGNFAGRDGYGRGGGRAGGGGGFRDRGERVELREDDDREDSRRGGRGELCGGERLTFCMPSSVVSCFSVRFCCFRLTSVLGPFGSCSCCLGSCSALGSIVFCFELQVILVKLEVV